jgi:arginase family enzyme
MGTAKFAYASNTNFFLASEALTAQPFAIVGVPFDGAVTNRPGARFGPQEIRRASLMLDIDCLDPAFAPGTGTPEPGGLTSSQLLTWLEALDTLQCVAMDCVEVAPAYDHAEMTSHAAATMVWTYLSGQVAKGLATG